MPAGDIGGSLAGVLLERLLRARDPIARHDPASGRYRLAYGRAWAWIAGLFVLISAGFLLFGVAVVRDDAVPLAIVVVVFGSMTAASLYALYDVAFVRLSFDGETLVKDSPLSGPVWVPWSRVVKVEYSNAASQIVFRSADGQTVRVSIYRNGLGTLADVAGAALQRGPMGTAPSVLYEKAAPPE